MSNSSFTGVSNEDSQNRISASSADISTIRAGIINCDRLDYPGNYPLTSIIFLTAGGGVSLDLSTSSTTSDAIISNISNKGLLLLSSAAIDAAGSIILGVDSSARAAQLLLLFGISDSVPTRLIRVSQLVKNGGSDVSIKNTTNSNIYIQYKEMTGITLTSVQSTAVICAANAVSDGYILVSKGSAVANSSTILFTVIGKGFA